MNTRASGGLLLTLLTMTCPAAEAATRVSKPAFPESVVIGDRTLRRQGTGVLKFKKVIALYDAALYLAEDGQPGKALQDVPKRIEVFYRVNAKAERFNRAGQKVLEKNFAGAELEAVRDRLKQMESWYPDARKGDRCAIQYIPGTGTELTHNDMSLGVVPGADFARLYFSIWLGDQPASKGLRNDLLNLESKGRE